MKKIPSLFKRNYDGDRQMYDEVTPGCEWVQRGEGVATRKLDGTACKIIDGNLWKRRTYREGKKEPPQFILEDRMEHPPDRNGKVIVKLYGWVPVDDGGESKYHREAWKWMSTIYRMQEEGKTFELIGPKVQGGADAGDEHHRLIKHGTIELKGAPRDFDGIKQYLTDHIMEGIVWHHPDGRMVKIKARDFGIEWPRKREDGD